MVNFIKKNKVYLLIGCFLVFVNSFLFWFNKTQVAQEFFYYPWMIGKGAIIYKDFFYNHGPLLYYLLAPLSSDKSFTLLKIFYTLVQSANLVIILIIVKKFSSITGFIVGGITFVILNFYFSYNYFWDEQIIATFYLLIYFLINSKEFALKSAFIGILIGLASLIKPNALIIAIPALFFYKKKSFLFFPVLIWLIIMLYFFLNNAFPQFIDNYISFNSHYQNHYIKYFPYFGAIKAEWLFLNFLMIIFIFAVHALNRKNINWKLIVFLLISTSCMYPLVGDDRFAPFTSFLAVFIAYLYTITNKKFIFFTILCFYLLVYAHQANSKIKNLQAQQTAIAATTAAVDTRSKKIISYLKNNNLYSKNFYIMSNNVEIYYLLDNPYKIHFPVMFPVVSSYYKNFQETDIADIKRNKTDLVVIPLPLDPDYTSANKVMTFIKTSYNLSYKDVDFLVYTIKTK